MAECNCFIFWKETLCWSVSKVLQVPASSGLWSEARSHQARSGRTGRADPHPRHFQFGTRTPTDSTWSLHGKYLDLDNRLVLRKTMGRFNWGFYCWLKKMVTRISVVGWILWLDIQTEKHTGRDGWMNLRLDKTVGQRLNGRKGWKKRTTEGALVANSCEHSLVDGVATSCFIMGILPFWINTDVESC